jgi:guanosine-3',5'-bis(diphosphate) 3'-pyrophosphohydrolase
MMAADTATLGMLFDALSFSAYRHRQQRRKGAAASPYINHPIDVARVLVTEGGSTDIAMLAAAVLHDTIEDTATTAGELSARFGPEVARLVMEVTDDQGLTAAERKRLQVERAPLLSPRAKAIRLSDKVCNVRDMVTDTPSGWSVERRRQYLDWTERVIAGCRGTNAALEAAYDVALAAARLALAAST